jgi:hypothetical protein
MATSIEYSHRGRCRAGMLWAAVSPISHYIVRRVRPSRWLLHWLLVRCAQTPTCTRCQVSIVHEAPAPAHIEAWRNRRRVGLQSSNRPTRVTPNFKADLRHHYDRPLISLQYERPLITRAEHSAGCKHILVSIPISRTSVIADQDICLDRLTGGHATSMQQPLGRADGRRSPLDGAAQPRCAEYGK